LKAPEMNIGDEHRPVFEPSQAVAHRAFYSLTERSTVIDLYGLAVMTEGAAADAADGHILYRYTEH